MIVQPISNLYFAYDGRGPALTRWIYDREMVLPSTDRGRTGLRGHPIGAEHDMGWVVFQGLQVLQSVPEEVHSYWFESLLPSGTKHTGLYEVLNSTWKASFNQRHLASQRHFILAFYDEVLEVLCRSLVFGLAPSVSTIIRNSRILVRSAHRDSRRQRATVQH